MIRPFSARDLPCRDCGATPGQPCTTPGPWYHTARHHTWAKLKDGSQR